MSAVTYSRPISGIERGYLNVAAQHDHPMIHLVLEGKGSLEPRALEAAVASACDANPGIAVVRRGTRWVGGGPLPAVISHAAPLTNANDVDLFRQGLDVVGGPVAEVHLFGHESTTLVLRATHAVSDGRGLQHWLRDVFRVLRGETPLGAPDTATDQHFVRTVKACRKPNTESSSSAPHARLSAPLFGATEAGGCIRWTGVPCHQRLSHERQDRRSGRTVCRRGSNRDHSRRPSPARPHSEFNRQPQRPTPTASES